MGVPPSQTNSPLLFSSYPRARSRFRCGLNILWGGRQEGGEGCQKGFVLQGKEVSVALRGTPLKKGGKQQQQSTDHKSPHAHTQIKVNIHRAQSEACLLRRKSKYSPWGFFQVKCGQDGASQPNSSHVYAKANPITVRGEYRQVSAASESNPWHVYSEASPII